MHKNAYNEKFLNGKTILFRLRSQNVNEWWKSLIEKKVFAHVRKIIVALICKRASNLKTKQLININPLLRFFHLYYAGISQRKADLPS